MSVIYEGYMAAKSLAETDDAFRDHPLVFLTTHVKCGGTISPIPDPPWLSKAPSYPYPHGMFGTCDRCGLSGEVVDPQ